jgi:hypothetical protein
LLVKLEAFHTISSQVPSMSATGETSMMRAVGELEAIYKRANISLFRLRSMGFGRASALGAIVTLEDTIEDNLNKLEAQAQGGLERFGSEWEHGDCGYQSQCNRRRLT